MKRVALIVALVLGGGVFAATALASQDAGSWGRYLGAIEDLAGPTAAAINADHEILVLESDASRVSVRDRQGDEVRQWGVRGSGPDQLLAPEGLAIDADGRCYIADTGNHRVQVFDADGRHLQGWGGYGREGGSFLSPHGIAVGDERVVVADTGNHRVQVFDRSGELMHVIGEYGGNDGRFIAPIDVAIGDGGTIFVADQFNHRVQVFSADGSWRATFGGFGTFPGQFSRPASVMFSDGRVFVTDTGNHRVQVMTALGDPEYQWGSHALWLRDGEGRFETPGGLAIAPDGAFIVVAEPLEDRCQIFGRYGDDAPETVPPARERSHFGKRLRADGDLLVIPEPDRQAIGVYNLSGDVPILVGKFGTGGSGYGQLLHAPALAVDATRSEVLVSDLALRRVQLFRLERPDRERIRYVSGTSQLVKAFDLAAAGEGWGAPNAIVQTASGDFVVVDTAAGRVTMFTPDLKIRNAWGRWGDEPGQFRGPTDVAIDAETGELFIVDALNGRVEVFDLEGQHLASLGASGPATQQLELPFGVALEPGGRIYVTDRATHQIKVYDRDGAWLDTWGERGEDEGQLFKPHGIAVDGRGRILISDYGNHRVQVFSPNGESVAMLGWRKPRVMPGADDE
jgi:DNA-binding beta-propeller fold protein YncE